MNAGNIRGGVETYLETLARTPGRFEAEFAVCFEGPFLERLRRSGRPVHVLGPVRARRPWSIWRARARLRRVLAEGRHEVVVGHGPWPHALAAPAARASGAKAVLFAHGPPGGTWVDRWARWSRPDAVLANSRHTERAMREELPGVACSVVHPAVPAPTPAARSARDRLRAELGAAPDEVVLVCVGRLDPCKGHRVLVEALRRLPGSLRWRAWIVGGAQTPSEVGLERWLREAAGSNGLAGRLRLLGLRDDVPALLAAADLYCQPNVTPDSFGISLVEALDAGLPVLTSALGGALEVIDPSCGVLLPPRDATGLAAHLERLIGDPSLRRSLGAAGPARARSLCDPAGQVEQLERALSPLVRAR